MLWILFCVGYFTSLVEGNYQCPDLVPSAQMTVSSMTGWVNETVTVSCDPGYVLDTGVLSKDIHCVTEGSTAVWTELLGTCSPKLCPDVSTILTDTTTSSVVQYSYGQFATVNCIVDHAFRIDTLADIDDRVETFKKVRCDDVIGMTTGAWSQQPGNCTLITCESAAVVTNAVQTVQGTAVGQTVRYNCMSGHILGNGEFSVTATCNGSAMWQTPSPFSRIEKVACTATPTYVGCLAPGALDTPITASIAINDAFKCKSHCLGVSKRYAGLQSDTCFCSDVATTTAETGIANCNQLCPGYDGTGTMPEQQVFCGGTGGQMSVYSTIDGCWENLDVSGLQTTVVAPDVHLTCQQRCLGLDQIYSIVYGGELCACADSLSMTTPTLVKAPASHCQNSTFYPVYQVIDLVHLVLNVSTCEELYELGVRYSGDYYLGNDKTTCSFYDGTNCEHGWIGFNGYCYLFVSDQRYEFEGAMQVCLDHDAEVVSIMSQEEFDFISLTREVFPDITPDNDGLDSGQWLGLVDAKQQSFYSWVDGSMSAFEDWPGVSDPALAPLNTASQCVHDDIWGWKTSACEGVKKYATCKKFAVGPYCASVSDTFEANRTLEHEQMSVTYCVQYCKGFSADLMLLKNHTCHCVHELPPHDVMNRSDCDTGCPGNGFQACGGNDTLYSVRNVTKIAPPVSCEELQLFGIDDSVFELFSNGDTIKEYCPKTDCGYGWVTILGHCYQFNRRRQSTHMAVFMCSKYDAYMVTFESEEEARLVTETANNITIYKDEGFWAIGYFAMSRNSGVYRWSNGRTQFENYATIYNFSPSSPTVLVYTNLHNYWRTSIGYYFHNPFICEKGKDYVGCFHVGGLQFLISDYTAMTIQQCVETCRAHDESYAVLQPTACACVSNLTSFVATVGQCLETCAGQENQACGNHLMEASVYSIDMYPSFAQSCMDIFYAGIFLSGDYVINGTVTYCNLTDGGVCPYGWLSIGGHCYHHFSANASLSRAEQCIRENSVQTSITTQQEYDVLVDYVTRVNLKGFDARTFTGIQNGEYDLNVFISTDGLLTFYGGVTGSFYVSDLFEAQEYATFRLVTTPLPRDGGTVCKTDIYQYGCYLNPNTLDFKLQNFGSMELGLCRQLCTTENYTVFLIGQDFCACAMDVVAFIATTDSACMVPCPIHPDQKCGDGTVMWAYNTGIGQVPLAESCSHLYRAGIFYNTTYSIQPPNDTVSQQQCGFADTTTCPASWLGRDGHCFKFFQNDFISFGAARDICFQRDSYLFNPVDTGKTIVNDFLINSTILNAFPVWWTGIWPTTFMRSYTYSNGRIATNHSVSSVPLVQGTAYEVINGGLTNPSKARFICQTDPEYLGCHVVSSTPFQTFTEVATNSLTQCSQLCIVFGAKFMAVRDTECLCLDDVSAMTSAFGHCTVPCPGNVQQACGGVEASTYNVVEIVSWPGLTGSCDEAWRLGMTYPGTYSLRHDEFSPYMNITCFNQPQAMANINDVKSIEGSPAGATFGIQNVLFSPGFTSAWRPLIAATTAKVVIHLNQEYLVTGLLVKGLHTAGNQEYVTSIRVRYRDVLLGDLHDVMEDDQNVIPTGCKDSSDICHVLFLEPFVSNEIHVFTNTWSGHPSMQVQLIGTLYAAFNHFDAYIGCVVDLENELINNGTATNISECISQCRNISQKFASIDSVSDCWCGSLTNPMFTSDLACPNRQSNGLFRTIYRTYYKLCPNPDPGAITNATLGAVMYPFTNGINTFKANTTYTCDIGFELPDGSKEQTVFCLQQTNSWQHPPLNCSAVSCQPFTVDNGHVTITSLDYSGEAYVYCTYGTWADSGEQNMTLMCEHTRFWSVEAPTCLTSNLKTKQRIYKIIHDTRRNDTTNAEQYEVRSQADCAAKCMENYFCLGANFRQLAAIDHEAGACLLFLNSSNPSDLYVDFGWNYLDIE